MAYRVYSLIFLRPLSPFLLQLFERRIDAAEQLEDNRGRDIRHDAQAENRRLAELAGAECGDHVEQVADAALSLPEEGTHLFRVHDGQGYLPADPIDGQQAQRQQNLLPQLGNRKDDANLFPHGSIRLISRGVGSQVAESVDCGPVFVPRPTREQAKS